MKYPIVLAHGVMIKDFKFFKAFGRIEAVLKENGYKVYTAKTDGMGSISNNAIELKREILEILELEGVDKVNIIAHSKGGLDSKYMLERLDMSSHVASLTSLCTPYKGSPIASFILKLPGFIIWCAKTWFNVVYKIFGDKNPDSLAVCKELMLVESINEECLNIATDAYVQSYSTTLKRSRDDFIMGIPMAFCKYAYKRETDGLVDEDSSKIGNYKGRAFDSISHTDIVDFMVGKKKKKKIYEFYLGICKSLEEMGF